MPVRLRPVADDEVASFVASTRDGYALSMVNDAGMGEEEARAKAERDFEMLVREGRPVAGQQVFIIEETETSERVGRDSRPAPSLRTPQAGRVSASS